MLQEILIPYLILSIWLVCSRLRLPFFEVRNLAFEVITVGDLGIFFPVVCATSFNWEHSPCNAFWKHISCFYQFSLGENILTDRSLTYYVKQVISWLLVLHLATWLEIYHTRQCCRIIFRRGHFTQKMLLHWHLQYPGSPSSHSLLEFLSGSHCWWLIIFFFWHWTIASTWPKPAAGPQPHLLWPKVLVEDELH